MVIVYLGSLNRSVMVAQIKVALKLTNVVAGHKCPIKESLREAERARRSVLKGAKMPSPVRISLKKTKTQTCNTFPILTWRNMLNLFICTKIITHYNNYF